MQARLSSEEARNSELNKRLSEIQVNNSQFESYSIISLNKIDNLTKESTRELEKREKRDLDLCVSSRRRITG